MTRNLQQLESDLRGSVPAVRLGADRLAEIRRRGARRRRAQRPVIGLPHYSAADLLEGGNTAKHFAELNT